MNKHTPGPWEVDNRPHSAINHGKKHIAMVNYWNAVDEEARVNEEEHQANARLIAAAPELFSGFVDAVTELHYTSEHRGAFPLCEHEECQRARALIVKVTGES